MNYNEFRIFQRTMDEAGLISFINRIGAGKFLMYEVQLNGELKRSYKQRRSAKKYLIRIFNHLNRTHMNGVELIAQERKEQIEKHGRTVERDVIENAHYELSGGAVQLLGLNGQKPQDWDAAIWERMVGKSLKERLIIAGALIAAEIDRMQAIEGEPQQADQPFERRDEGKEGLEVRFGKERTCTECGHDLPSYNFNSENDVCYMCEDKQPKGGREV